MTPPLTWSLDRGRDSVLVTVRGTPHLGPGTAFFALLTTRLAERPGALLLDIPALDRADIRTVSLLADVAHRAAVPPGTATLLRSTPTGPVRSPTDEPDRRVPLARSLRTIRSVLRGELGTAMTISDHLLPVSGAGRHARNVATEACARWGLSCLVPAATLVADELVHHAADRAGSILTLTLTGHRGVLYVAVQHSATVRPATDGGHLTTSLGLRIVQSLADWWGYLPMGGDVVVCAALPAPQLRNP